MYRKGDIAREVIMVILAMLGVCLPVAASGIDIVLSGQGKPYMAFVAGIRSALQEADIQVGIRIVQAGTGMAHDEGKTRLIVTAGVKAMRRVGSETGVPVIHALIPARVFPQATSSGHHAYVYLDQPAERIIRLIRHAFGAKTRIGIIHGKGAERQVELLRRAAKKAGLGFDARSIAHARDLFPVLREIVEEVDVFLVVPDELVINPSTLQSLLLTTYHAGIPLVAYSPAFTRIGAVLAIYTTPYQAGMQTGKLIVRILSGERIRYPVQEWARYFSIRSNTRVAESLGVEIPDSGTLTRALKKP